MTSNNDPYVRYTRALDEPDAADNVALRFAVENADSVPMMPCGDLYRVTIERIPEPEEEPRWWYWFNVDSRWEPSTTSDVQILMSGNIVVYGTTRDRDDKRERLQAVAREVGKP